MSLLSLGGFFTEAVAETWMSIWLSLNSMVYGLISTLYQLFVTVANVSLFSDEVFEQITGRLYVIMGIAMLFIFAYNLVLMIINPEEKKSTGQTTKIVKETIISLVLIILLPTIFKYMSTFQYHVLNSGIIGQIILGDSTSEDDCDYADMEMLNTHIDAEKQDVSIGTYCLKGGAGGAAVGAAGGAVVGAVATPVGSGVAGLIGGAGGAIVGCVGGTIVGGVKQIATWFGYKDDQITANLSGACQLYNALPDAEKGARIVAPTIFSAFYHPTKFGYNDCVNYLKTCGDDSGCDYTFDEGNTSSDEIKNGKIDTDDEKKICAFYVYDVDMAKYSGSMSVFNEDSEFINRIKGDEEIFEFNYFLAFLAGALALWMFFCYTYAIGKRVAKLGFLQIVSPITVMMRIVPKQKEAIFDKWLKELINTYLDVFIRLVIIYFCLFGVSLVPDVINNLFKSASGGFVMASLASVVVILGILQFAQEAPELFKQFFGGGNGSFSLKSPKKQFNENKLAKGAIGYVGGSALGLASSIARGKNPISGLWRGGKNAAKSMAGADLTKKGAFLDTMKTSKYLTDYEQNHSKYQAIKQKGLKGYVGEQAETFKKFIYDSGGLSEIIGAATSMHSQLTDIDNAIIKKVVTDESNAKELYGKGEAFHLGDDYYKMMDDGRWHNTANPSAKSISNDDMFGVIKDYFKTEKRNAFVKAMTDTEDGKKNQGKYDIWASEFEKSMRENFPKLGTEIAENLFNELSTKEGIKVQNMDELMKTMKDLRNSEDWDKLAGLKSIMEGQMKDTKENRFNYSPDDKKGK